MKNVLEVAIVGCGGMGSIHALALQTGTGDTVWNLINPSAKQIDTRLTTDISKLLHLKGICDIKEDRLQWACEHGIFTYSGYDAILADPDIDIVFIVTPNHTHHDLAIAAMKAGKHVFCEKPVMVSSKELEEVLRVSKETGKIFYPRQNRRWDKDYLTVKQIYEHELVGKVFHIESRVLGSRGIPDDWRREKACGGGMMLDWGVHLIDRILMLIPEKVTCVFASMSHITNKEVDDGFQMHMTFESGLTAIVEVGTCHFIPQPMWMINGVQGTCLIESWNMQGKLIRLKSWENKDTTPVMAGEGWTKTMAPREDEAVDTYSLPEFEYDHNELYKNLYDTILGRTDPIVTGEQALRVLRLMEAAFESDRTKQTIAFES